jgi:uncharacterized protein involved in exopolysaccharide biosynthesis
VADDSTGNAEFNHANLPRFVGLADLLGVLSRHKLCLVVWLLGALGLGVWYSSHASPTYKISSRVLVQTEGSRLDASGSPRFDVGFLATQSQIIGSPAVIERAVASMTTPLTVEPNKSPVLAVLEDLSVKPLSGTHVLTVSYQCKNPDEGISLVSSVLESYQQFLKDMDDNSRLETLRLLTQSEAQLRSDLEEREQRYRELRMQSPLVGRDATNLQATSLEQVGQDLSATRNRRIDFQNRLASLEKSTDGSVVTEPAKEVLTSLIADTQPSTNQNENLALYLIADVKTGKPDPAQIFEELYRAEVRQKELAQRCGPDHPSMRAEQEKIAAWKKRLDGLNEQAPIALQREIDAALNRENQLSELYNAELKQAKANDDFLIIEKQELDGIERLKTIHNSLVFQLKDWRLMAPGDDGVWGTKMSIIEAPTYGAGPIWPKLPIVLVLSAAIAVVGAIGTIAVMERRAWTSNGSDA